MEPPDLIGYSTLRDAVLQGNNLAQYNDSLNEELIPRVFWTISMSTKMDVDPPAGTETKEIQFHPLAIVHMADQYTRITRGGSPLSVASPVVGLLFGTEACDHLEIVDADEISSNNLCHDDASNKCHLQISLHQAVFPQHSVLGWYRVSTESEPNATDLRITQSLARQFQNSQFCFCFCQMESSNNSLEDPRSVESIINNISNDALPISLYQISSDGTVLLGLILDENWKLVTSEPERIAVETVLRHKTPSSRSSTTTKSNTNDVPSRFESHMTTTEQALCKLKERCEILKVFLRDTHNGTIPFHAPLMRSVASVVCQLGRLFASSNEENPTVGPSPTAETWLSHLAVATKTVHTVQIYTEKIREMQDHAQGFGKRSGGSGSAVGIVGMGGGGGQRRL